MAMSNVLDLPHVRLQAIAALCKLCESEADASAIEVAAHLNDVYGLNVHWRTIEKHLSIDKTQISRRKSKRRWRYKPTVAGARLVEAHSDGDGHADAGASSKAHRKSGVTPANKNVDKVRIFIASSTEGLEIAEAIQLNLDHEAEC